MRAAFEHAADTVIDYAQAHPAPLLVIEELQDDPRPLVEITHGEVRQSSWVPPVALEVLIDRAAAAGVPVATVDPEHTSQEYHHCGEIGDLSPKGLHRRRDDCPVKKICRDRSAALTIARRGQNNL